MTSSQTRWDEQRQHRRAEEHGGREQARHAERAGWVGIWLVLAGRAPRLDNASRRGLVCRVASPGAMRLRVWLC